MSPRQAAKAKGLKVFFSGTSCKKGHVGEKYVSDGSCVVCTKARARKRAKKKSSEISEYQKRYYRENAVDVRDRVKQYREANLTRVKDQKKREYEKHKDRYIMKAKRWSEENPKERREAARRWHRRHPDRSYANALKRRMAKMQRQPNWLTDEQKRTIREVYAEARRLSETTGTTFQVDHIVPLRGENVSGLHVPWNLQILTAADNRAKGNTARCGVN